jgi:hypothetical protein
MRRRAFITLAGAAIVVSPLHLRAQQPARVRRIGVLLPFNNENDGPVRQLWPAFAQRLAELGWVEGRNIKYDVHFTTQNNEKIRVGAAELVATAPELIVVWSNPGLAAIKEARCELRRSHPEGRKASGSARTSADQVSARHQS